MQSQKKVYISGNFLYIISQVLHVVPISGTFGGMEQPLKALWGSLQLDAFFVLMLMW